MRAMRRRTRTTFTLSLALLAACSSDNTATPVGLAPGAPEAEGGDNLPPELKAVPMQAALKARGISAPVEVVRDDAGIPHIYGDTLADVAFAQGYVTAHDRFVQMDFIRRNASGTLSELFGEQTLADDVEMRMHHLRATAEKVWSMLTSSTDPLDHDVVETLEAYAKGVNLKLAEMRTGDAKAPALPAELTDLGYKPEFLAPWSPLDSLVIGELQAFALSFDLSADLLRTGAFRREAEVFGAPGATPALAAREGFVADLTDFRPFLPTYTIEGWGEADRSTQLAAAVRPPLRAPEADPQLVGLIGQILPRAGRVLAFGPGERGSNNWVVSGQHSATGHAMLANDTHLSLSNPALFYLVHLTAGQDFEVMGVQFPGVPLITLGFNRRVAWGATVSVLDVTDVYDEAVAPCGDASCVTFQGKQVPLAARDEAFRVAIGGDLSKAETKTVRLYDVPHHGPIIPRVGSNGDVAPLGARELSVRYTGYDGYPIFRGILSLNRATSAAEGRQAAEAHLAYGRQNWVFADVEGHIGWTQGTRLPRRPADSKPWMVMPGDGSAEWQGYVDVTKMPRAFDPAKGYLVTANADPVGVTGDNDPMNEPVVDGFPLYIGADYDPGSRATRATQRIQDATAGGKKLDRDGMASIQADAISKLGEAMRPHFVAATEKLVEEAATPGTHPDLSALVSNTRSEVTALYAEARDVVAAWKFDTPSGLEEGIDQAGIDESRAALLIAVFTTKLNLLALSDEAAALKSGTGFEIPTRTVGHDRLLPRLLNAPETLHAGAGTPEGGNILFDDVATPDVVETRDFTIARAVTQTLEWLLDQTKPVGDKPAKLEADPKTWVWGKVHFVKPAFFSPLFPALYQDAYPRHGGTGTVDVADPGFGDDDYEFRSGAAIRFVCELDPQRGPLARNVVPGGQVFDRQSPHYKDQLELWAKNQTLDLPFKVADVVERAKKEEATNKLGRLRFVP
jgi:penicillin G amidase